MEDNRKQKEPKLDVKENNNKEKDYISSSNEEEINVKKPKDETLIISDSKSKSLENNNKKNYSSTPLIQDNIYLNNKLKDDHYIFIERTKFFKIPYFNFGFTTHFYLPTAKLQTKMKLSEIPNPPFTIGPDGKYIFFLYLSLNK